MQSSFVNVMGRASEADLERAGPSCRDHPAKILSVHEDGYLRGIELFNQQNFYDAHEIWEDVWRATHGPEKKFLQGLIQVAVAFHHHSTGNVVGACSLLERARRNLIAYPGEFKGIRVATLVGALATCRDALSAGRTLPALPKLGEHEESG